MSLPPTPTCSASCGRAAASSSKPLRRSASFSKANRTIQQTTDPALKRPLEEAVARLEATEAGLLCDERAPGGPRSPHSPRSPGSLRRVFRDAALVEDDGACAAAVHAMMARACPSESAGADELIDALVAMLEAEPPTDAEMARLCALQERTHGSAGEEGYAVASAWFAALWVRIERCLEARARLTRRLQGLSLHDKAAVGSACAHLVREAPPPVEWVPSDVTRRALDEGRGEGGAASLPALLALLRQKRRWVDEQLRTVGVHEVGVRSGKGVSAALSITGTALAFSPALPLGVGLLMTGAGVGVTTAGADLLG
eukprot:1358548-Prymnesium_polylepis.1